MENKKQTIEVLMELAVICTSKADELTDQAIRELHPLSCDMQKLYESATMTGKARAYLEIAQLIREQIKNL